MATTSDQVQAAADRATFAEGQLLGAQAVLEAIRDAIFAVRHYRGDSQLLQGLYEAQRVAEAERRRLMLESTLAMIQHTSAMAQNTSQQLARIS